MTSPLPPLGAPPPDEPVAWAAAKRVFDEHMAASKPLHIASWALEGIAASHAIAFEIARRIAPLTVGTLAWSVVSMVFIGLTFVIVALMHSHRMARCDVINELRDDILRIRGEALLRWLDGGKQ